MSGNSEERFTRLEVSLERTGKTLARTRLIMEGEQIKVSRTKPDVFNRRMTIYLDDLTEEQKQELNRIERTLFDMAEEVTEEGRRTLKDGGVVKGGKETK